MSAELAGQQPRAAGCNYALRLQRKLLAVGACAGPGCTLAAGLEGTMEIETSGSRGRGGAGRGRRQAERERERARATPGAERAETHALPGSGLLFPRWKTKSGAPCDQPPDLVPADPVFRAVCLPDFLNSTSQPVSIGASLQQLAAGKNKRSRDDTGSSLLTGASVPRPQPQRTPR